MRCVWFYHDGGKACETCACPGRAAFVQQTASRPNRASSRPKCIDCGQSVVVGPRCMSCSASYREDVKAEELMRRSAPLKERYSA